jgi:hypothetical protein
MRASTAWPNYLPNPHLLTRSHGGKYFNKWILGGQKYLVHNMTNVWVVQSTLKIQVLLPSKCESVRTWVQTPISHTHTQKCFGS